MPSPARRSPCQQEQADAVAPLAQQVAMHVAGMRPSYVHRADVPAAVLQQQSEVRKHHVCGACGCLGLLLSRCWSALVLFARCTSQPAAFLEEAVLLEQRFVLDDTVTVAALVDRLARVRKPPCHCDDSQWVPVAQALTRCKFLGAG